MTTPSSIDADRAQAIRRHLRAIEALLDGKSGDFDATDGSVETIAPEELSINGGSKRLLTVKKVAGLFDVTERAVWYWIEKKKIRAYSTPGGLTLVDPDSLVLTPIA